MAPAFPLFHRISSVYRFLQVPEVVQAVEDPDTDRISAHLFDLLRHIHPVFHCIGIAQCIGQSNLRMPSAFLLLHPVGGVYRLLQVAQVVQAVKNTDNINAVGNGFFYEIIHHVIRIRTVSKDILSSEKHL